MSTAGCNVCGGKYMFLFLEIRYCNSCQRAFSLCVKCEVLRPEYRQPDEPGYCPQCNEKLRDGDLVPDTNGVLMREVMSPSRFRK